jgi:RNA polymerase sigma-70 factor (ECF subfamily)
MRSIGNAGVQSVADASASDEVLVNRILSGEKLLFAAVMRRYNQRLFRAVRAIVREDDEAEDVVQHAYVTAYDNLARYRGGARFGAWLTRIAINEAHGRLRKNKSRQRLTLLDGGDRMDGASSDPENAAYRRELAAVLEGHIDGLAEHLRVVFVLRDVEELDTRETAAALNTSEEAVRVRLHRARQQLQQRLAEAMVSAPETFRFGGERCNRTVATVFERLMLPLGGNET